MKNLKETLEKKLKSLKDNYIYYLNFFVNSSEDNETKEVKKSSFKIDLKKIDFKERVDLVVKFIKSNKIIITLHFILFVIAFGSYSFIDIIGYYLYYPSLFFSSILIAILLKPEKFIPKNNFFIEKIVINYALIIVTITLSHLIYNLIF